MQVINPIKGFVVVAVAAFFMACGGSPADKMMGFQEKLVSILEANKGDLDKAASEVDAFLTSNKDAMKSTMKEMMEWGMAQQEKFKNDPEGAKKVAEDMEKKSEAFTARMKKLEEEVPAMKEHEGLNKAMAKMGESMME